MLQGALLIYWSEIAQEVVVLAHFCTHLSKVNVVFFSLFSSFAPHHVSALVFNRITGSPQLSIALYFCTIASFANQTHALCIQVLQHRAIAAHPTHFTLSEYVGGGDSGQALAVCDVLLDSNI